MLVRKPVILLVAVGILGFANAALAQRTAGQERDTPLLDRLDNLGKAIFGGVLPSEKTKSKDAATPKTARSASRKSKVTEQTDEVDPPQAAGGRAGSILADSEANTRSPSRGKPTGDSSGIASENGLRAVPRTADGTPKPVRRPLAGPSLLDEGDAAENSSAQTPTGPRTTAGGRAESASPQITRPTTAKLTSRPLYQRLSAFRQSAFASDSAGESHPQVKLGSESTSDTPAVKAVDSELATPKPAARPLVAEHMAREVEAARGLAAEPVPDPAPNSPTSPEKTPVTIEKTPVTPETTPVTIEKTPITPQKTPVAAERTPVATKKAPVMLEPPPVAAQAEGDGGLLIARKGPVLSVETAGPRRITVGRESAYEVSIVNSGEVAAEELVVFVSLPEWAEVAGAEVSNGAAQANGTGPTAASVQWKLNHLDAKGRERMTLKIIPRQNRPFDLAVRWEYKPVASQAAIEVQEPKLALQLEGPRELVYGKKEVYRLKLTNSGNGGAENVTIMLMPIGGGENVPASHKIGTLAAGEEKVLDVELTARQAGNLTIQVDARADGGIHTELAEKVLVRRGGLKIDVEGPKVQFVGTAASYAVRIRNTGTAPARNISLAIVLPAGAKYLAGIEGARLDTSGSKLEWTVANLSPEVEQSFVLKCSLGAAGVSRVQVIATADDDLTASANTVTRVESVANLAMDVKGPEGPAPVGEEVIYQVRVRNRGTKEAVGVEVFGYFSRGIEPTAAEGNPNRLTPGQVAFQPISSLAPGAEVVLKIHARAEIAGNHIFRAEAVCKPLGARLVSEATDLYYTNATASQQVANDSGAEGPAPDAMRTVTRSFQGQQPPPPRK
jgi:uncharacterized repeat protein (TIGR01451 family)